MVSFRKINLGMGVISLDLLTEMGNIKTKIKDPNQSSFKGRSTNLGEWYDDVDYDNLKRSDSFLVDLKRNGFNLEEMEDAIKTEGNQLIVAIAGSGKTTTLLCKLQYNILTGELAKKLEVNGELRPVMGNVLVCTFLKSGAEDLKKRMSDLQASMGLQKTSHMIKFSTLHAEFYQILKELGYSIDIISDKDNKSLLKKAVDACDIRYNGRKLNSNQLQNLETALYFTRSRLDEKRYISDIYLECGIGPAEVDNLINKWSSLRLLDGKMDFSDLEEILYNFCYVNINEEVLNYIGSKYDFIYVDEFQDTSQIQYKLLKVMAIGAKKVVAVGDDDQTIYSWRGSDINIITKHFMKDFEAKLDKLTYNFRCPSKVLNTVKDSIANNKNRIPKGLRAAVDGGNAKVAKYTRVEDACKYLNKVAYDALTKNKTVAVICRTNFDGLIPAISFENNGRFSFSISSKAMTLDNYIGRLILRIGMIFNSHSADVIRSVLRSLSWEESYNIGAMAKFCEENKLTIFETDDEDLKYSIPETASLIIGWKLSLRENGEIETFREILEYFKNTVFRKDNPFNNNCRAVIDAVLMYSRNDTNESARDIIEGLYNLNKSLVSRIGNENARVKIVTVHEFKGKEADVVLVWNDSKGVFPPAFNMSNEDIEEERRVHYIACTRAKEDLHIISHFNKPGDFFGELDLREAEVIRL